ncbi:hypothetical protein DW651_03040 [Subdoligranulum sp. AM23-21AC]|nr:hypothetical protein DW651_03040 [Subdoligranulum sp. AM23-21AC]
MKWNKNGIKFLRGCHEVLIAQYDGKGPWYCNIPIMTQQSMKTCFKELGEYLEAESVEVKYLYDEDDTPTENETMDFMRKYDGTYIFRACHVE